MNGSTTIDTTMPPPSWTTFPDLSGQSWRHPTGRHLLHWLSKRNSLLRTIAAAKPGAETPATWQLTASATPLF